MVTSLGRLCLTAWKSFVGGTGDAVHSHSYLLFNGDAKTNVEGNSFFIKRVHLYSTVTVEEGEGEFNSQQRQQQKRQKEKIKENLEKEKNTQQFTPADVDYI